MFLRFFYLFLWIPFLCFSSFEDGKKFFDEGDCEQARTILSKDSFSENWRAQLYLLASQGFTAGERSEPLLVGLKSHIDRIINSPSHADYTAANLVHAFWHLYSERTNNLSPDVIAGVSSSLIRTREASSHLPRSVTLLAAHEGEGLLASPQANSSYHAINIGNEAETENFPPLRSGLEEINTAEIRQAIRQDSYFPIDTLFTEDPSQERGLKVLEKLCREGSHHAHYFLSVFYLGLDGGGKDIKTLGLGYLLSAGELENVSAHNKIKEFLKMLPQEGWAPNCKFWCGCPPYGVSRLGCGGDSGGRWWNCGLGVCGYATRWTAEKFFFNIRHVSRTTLRHFLASASAAAVLIQLLETQGLIDWFDSDQTAPGWLGFFGAAIAYLDSAKKR